MLQYIEEREIKAPDQQVHDVICNLEDYCNWNHWIHHAEGSVQDGGDIIVKTTIGDMERIFKHKVIKNEAPSLFHWCDVGWFTFLAYGQRIRKIKHITPDSCLYHVELRVEGFASYFVNVFFGDFMRKGLAAEADSLKSYSEHLYQQSLNQTEASEANS